MERISMDLEGLAAAAALVAGPEQMSDGEVGTRTTTAAAAPAATATPTGQRRSTRRQDNPTAMAGPVAIADTRAASRKRAASALTEVADKALPTTNSGSSSSGNNAGKGQKKDKVKGKGAGSRVGAISDNMATTAASAEDSINGGSSSSSKRRRLAAPAADRPGQDQLYTYDSRTTAADAAGSMNGQGVQVAAEDDNDDDNQNRGTLNNEDLAASAALQSFTSDSRNTSITSPTQPNTPLSADGAGGSAAGGEEEGQARKAGGGGASSYSGTGVMMMEGRGSSSSTSSTENRGIFEAHPQVMPLLPPELTNAASAVVSPALSSREDAGKSGLAASSSAGVSGHLPEQKGATSIQASIDGSGAATAAAAHMPGVNTESTLASYAAPAPAASASSQPAYSHYQPASDNQQGQQQQPTWSPSSLLSSYKLPPIPVPHAGDTAVPSSSNLSVGSAFPPGPSTYHHEPLPYGDLHYPIEDSLAGLDQQLSHQLPPAPLEYSHQSHTTAEQQLAPPPHEQQYQQSFADVDVTSEGSAPLVPAKKQKGRRPNLQTGEAKNHRCSFEGCAWTFSRREHLKRHEKTHTQDRPFTCDVPMCDLRFSRLDNLNSHKRTHEKGKRTSQWHVAKVVGNGDADAGQRSLSTVQSTGAESQTPGSSTGHQSPLYIPPYGHDSYASGLDTQNPYGGYELAGLYESSPLPPLPPATSSAAPQEQEQYTNGIPVPQADMDGTPMPYLPPLPQPTQNGKRKRGTGVQK